MNATLKSLALSAVLFLHGLSGCAQTEVPVRNSPYSIQANIGYTSYDLSDAKKVHESIVSVYDSYGIAVPTQKEFGPGLVIGLAALRDLPRGTSFGLGSQYSRATARSAYADYSGTLTVTSTVSFVTLEGILQHDFQSQSKYHFFAAVRGGLAFIHAEYKQELLYNNLPSQSGIGSIAGSGTGYTAEGMVGVKRSFQQVDFMLTAGYRRTSVSELDATITGTGQTTQNGTMSVTHNMSGVALNLRVAYRF